MKFCWIWEASCDGDQYAAWVAAIGTILALVVAIGLAYHQNWKENKRRIQETEDRHRRQLLEIVFLAEAMYEIVTDLSQDLESGGVYDKPRYTEASGDLLNDIRQLITDALSDDQKTYYFTLRRKFAEIFSHIHFGNAGVYAQNHANDIKELCKRFRSYL